MRARLPAQVLRVDARDRATCVGARLAPSRRMPLHVEDIMTRDVVSFFPEQTLPLAGDVMRIRRFHHIPVTEADGRLLGIVSQLDLLLSRDGDVQVADLMTKDVWTVRRDTLAENACRTLLDHEFRCLPVVDELGRLCGIITERDFLRYAIRALAADTL
jgi:CBS domain-containing protein